MHHIGRQALRASSRGPAKFVAGRRYPRIASRTFHQTASVPYPRTPPRQSQDDLQTRRDIHTGQNHQDRAPASHEHEPPTLSGRSDGLPTVEFPDWFLDKNVTLCDESSSAPGIESEIWIQSIGSESAQRYSMTADWSLIRTACQAAWNKESGAARDGNTFDREMESLCNVNDAASDFWKRIKDHEEHRSHKHALDPLSHSEIKRKLAAIIDAPYLDDKTPHSGKANALLRTSTEEDLVPLVKEMAAELNCDVVQIDAQDIAELLGGYLGGKDRAFSKDIRSLGFSTYAGRGISIQREQREEQEEEEEDEQSDEDDESDAPNHSTNMAMPPGLKSQLFPLSRIAGFSAMVVDGVTGKRINLGNNQSSRGSHEPEDLVENLKIRSWLSRLLELPHSKRTSQSRTETTLRLKVDSDPSPSSLVHTDGFDGRARLIQSSLEDATGATTVRNTFFVDVSALVSPAPRHDRKVEICFGEGARPNQPSPGAPRTMIVVRDLKEIADVRVGNFVLGQLQRIVQSRREKGENIAIIGTTSDQASPNPPSGFFPVDFEASHNVLDVRQLEMIDYPSKTFNEALKVFDLATPVQKTKPSDNRTLAINVRHITDMFRTSDAAAISATPIFAEEHELSYPDSYTEHILTPEKVYELMLVTTGTSIMRGLPPSLYRSADHHMQAISCLQDAMALLSARDRGRPKGNVLSTVQLAHTIMNKRPSGARDNSHEKRLKGGIIDPDQIKTSFQDVHVSPDTIETLKTLTSLSLLRPEAFTYGVLARSKIPGLLLYGPPGTGKTLLAKAVAKDTRATVLEVSGADLNDKYVGEGEKNVKAVFSLARKLSPCVVFIDEADAILSSRSSETSSRGHRETINQFLKEWDGMNEQGVFIMVATNRPFDLDDAVLRRLPRRILVDLPVKTDREKILDIHLRDEQLDSTISLPKLAEDTKLYSGSDLKNLCVSAALACVKEEYEAELVSGVTHISANDTPTSDSPTDSVRHEQNAHPETDQETKEQVPLKRRVLLQRHFDKALREITSSVSEDMGSLAAIRKFDERFGDKMARGKKKSRWGFGQVDAEAEAAASERAARVRS